MPKQASVYCNRGENHLLEIFGNPYMKNMKSRTPWQEIPLKNKKSRTLNKEVNYPFACNRGIK